MRLLNPDPSRRPTQVKVCGITRIEDALLAAELDVEAIGLNFHPGSPRYVDPERAAEIRAAMPEGPDAIGVFVNLPVADVRAIADAAGLTAVQLHGAEPAEAIAELQPIPVIKAFRCRDVITIVAGR